MDEKKLPRRPVAGSRVPTTAPRRIAGRSARPEEREASAEEAPITESGEAAESTDAGAGEGDPELSEPDATEVAGQRGVLGRRTTTTVLVALAGLLALVIIAMLTWTGWQGSRGDEGSEHVMAFDREYAVKEKPVRIPVADWNAANNAAEKAITEIFTFDWKDYDENVEDARALITDKFEKEYSKTAKATREKFVASKADYEVTVVGRSVVEATPDEVATLIFLNQFVYKGEGDERTGPEVYQARMLVRMVRTDRGWLVDELRTD